MIEYLSHDAFAGLLRPPSSMGNNPIFRGTIRVKDRRLSCFIKPFPDHIWCPVSGTAVPNRELAAEALGYCLAKSMGLETPDVAGIILLKAEHIPDELTDGLKRAGLGTTQSDYLCWFTQDMDCKSLRQSLEGISNPILFARQCRRAVLSLVENPRLPQIIAFDDWLANSDRNVGNLLLGTNRLFLIDHGRLLVYPNWKPGELGNFGKPWSNPLVELVDQFSPNWSLHLKSKSARALAFNGYAVEFARSGAKTTRTALSSLLSPDEVDLVIELLSSRLNPSKYTQAVGLLV